MAENATTKHRAANAGIQCESTVHTIGDRAIARLPDSASAQLPSRGQVSVSGTVNGHPFRTVLEPDGERGHWLDLRGDFASRLMLNAGDTVVLEFEPTQDWPEPDVPDDLRAALNEAADASELWADITPMARWEWVRWIKATKNQETRARRVEVSISKLRSGKRRPCCFNLASCTDPELSKSGKLL